MVPLALNPGDRRMVARRETYRVTSGTGRIEVRESPDRWASALFAEGRPFALDWPDCAGSIGHHFFRAEPLTPSGIPFDNLYGRVAALPDPSHPLASVVAPLLEQFPSGDYVLWLARLTEDDSTHDWWDDSPLRTHGGYYPFPGAVIIATLPEEQLDDARIGEHLRRLERGETPLLITASDRNADEEYLLDGHHKLYASYFLRVPLWRLCITPLDPHPLAFEDWPSSAGTPPPSWFATFDRPHKVRKGFVVV
jgi:hypothetical protein